MSGTPLGRRLASVRSAMVEPMPEPEVEDHLDRVWDDLAEANREILEMRMALRKANKEARRYREKYNEARRQLAQFGQGPQEEVRTTMAAKKAQKPKPKSRDAAKETVAKAKKAIAANAAARPKVIVKKVVEE